MQDFSNSASAGASSDEDESFRLSGSDEGESDEEEDAEREESDGSDNDELAEEPDATPPTEDFSKKRKEHEEDEEEEEEEEDDEDEDDDDDEDEEDSYLDDDPEEDERGGPYDSTTCLQNAIVEMVTFTITFLDSLDKDAFIRLLNREKSSILQFSPKNEPVVDTINILKAVKKQGDNNEYGIKEYEVVLGSLAGPRGRQTVTGQAVLRYRNALGYITSY